MAWYEDLPRRKRDGKVRVRATVQNAHHRAPTAVDPKTGKKKTEWRRTFDTKTAARRWAQGIEADLDQGIDPDAVPVRPEAETLTLAAWRARWWPTYCRATRKAPRSVEETDRRWRLHVEPRWGDTTLAVFDRLEIQDWVDEELAGWAAPGYVELIYKDLHLLCESAVDHRPQILAHNPCHKIRMPDPNAAEVVHTDAAGVSGVAGRCGFYADLVWCLWGTGWRWAEMVGLRRDLETADGPCIDVENNVLRLHPTLGCLVESDGGLASGPPKTRGSARATAVPQFVMDFVSARLDAPDVRPARVRKAHPAPSPYVWLGPRGGVLRRSSFNRRVWRPACDGREEEPRRRGTRGKPALEPLVPGMRVHGLRHSHKAVLEAAGVPDSAIEARLGHARGGISGVYSHVLPETEARIVKVLQSRYEAATVL